MITRRQEKALTDIISKTVDVPLKTDIPFNSRQMELLQELNTFCANQVLDDIEVLRDPRKIIYKTNQEMQYALAALCLARALVDPETRRHENKEFFTENISVCTEINGTKDINFGKIDTMHALDAVYPEIIVDWMIYRDKNGRGINALVDKKTRLYGAQEFQRGGDPLYEFARFERIYTKNKFFKEEKAKESAQEAFRNAMVQTVAKELAQQQMLSGKNPLELIELLFAAEDYESAVKALAAPKKELPNQTKLLGYTNQRDEKIHKR